MIVITLTKVPNSLRGDLTKWYQEVQTGVYVGNVSARIRELLWDRIVKNIGHGEATMVYNFNNELGYQFRTTRQDREVVDFEGVPLMMHLDVTNGAVQHGFSNAAKFHKAKVMAHRATNKVQSVVSKPMVAVDLETTGLDPTKDEIISIGAVRRLEDNQVEQFYRLIKIKQTIPKKITELTKITPEMLNSEGVSLRTGLEGLQDFIKDLPIVGYNLYFDETFLAEGFKKVGLLNVSNQLIDLMPIVKKTNKFLDNYRLQTVIDEYDIENDQPHNALSDAKATFELASKLTKNGTFGI